MIRKLTLKNFKCFGDVEMKFSALNVLTGLNGMGKSTIMQSILLLGQSQKSLKTDKTLSLKGKFVNLGVGQDVLYEKAEKDEIGISIEIDEDKEELAFEYLPESDSLPLKEIKIDGKTEALEQKLENLFYLSAYRIEPQFLYRIKNEKEFENKYFGKNGEYAIQYLKLYGGDEIQNNNIVINNFDKTTIMDQVKAWLDMISPGISPVININTSSRTAELQYEYIEDRVKTNSYKSVNVGFGITYVLPVVVELVSAKKGDIVLIENPEAHIHPKGQRMLGELIALASAGGVQIIVETHSDHILNGIRLMAKKERIQAEKVSFFFFYKDMSDSYNHRFVQPVLDQNGRLNEWPEGFFDEWDNALLELL